MPPVLCDDVDIDGWGLREKVLNGPVVEIFAKSFDGGAAEDDVGDALVTDELGSSAGHAGTFDGDYLSAKVACKLHVGFERAGFFVAVACVDVEDEEFAVDSLCDPRPACDENLRGAVGADADGHTLAHGPVLLNALCIHVGGKRAVYRFGDVLQGQFTKGDEIAAAEEVGERLLRATGAVD